MSVDISKIRPGDEVTVRFYAVSGCGDLIGIASDPMHPPALNVRAGRIISHTPRALAVGDTVSWRQSSWRWQIIAIDREWAWLRDPQDCGVIKRLSDLERIDGAPGEGS